MEGWGCSECLSVPGFGYGCLLTSNSQCTREVESSWNVMAHGDAREGKWRGNWRMEWVASTLHITSERGVSSITTVDAHTSDASSRLNWRPCRFKMDSSVSPKDEIWFLRVCHRISNAVYLLCDVGSGIQWNRRRGGSGSVTAKPVVFQTYCTLCENSAPSAERPCLW